MELFACRASKGFAEKVIESLNANVRPGEQPVHLGGLEVTQFSDGEFQPLFTESVRGATRRPYRLPTILWNFFFASMQPKEHQPTKL